MSRVGAVIVAAGKSKRMGGADKLFVELAGKPLLVHTVDAFEACPSVDEIVIVLAEESVDRGRSLAEQHGWRKVSAICRGGAERQDSVLAGLSSLSRCDWVVIHDGARPCVSPDLIEGGLAEAAEGGAAIAAVPVTDTIKVVSPSRHIEKTQPRENLWAAQTPQVFRVDIIREAFRKSGGYVTDDAALVEKLSCAVKVYPGSKSNIKVTSPEDLVLAEAVLRGRGQG